MSIFGRIFRPRKGKVARRETSSGSSAARSGAWSLLVSSPGAMQVATVYRCVTLLSEKIASLEVRVSRRSGGLFVENPSDRLWYLLNVQPDIYLTAFDFWKQVVQHLLLQGNAYIVPVWDVAAMEWSRLALPNPSSVSHDTVNDIYTVNDLTAGICGVYSESEIIHLKNYSRDGKTGISTIAFARMTLDIVGTGDAETGGFAARRGLLFFIKICKMQTKWLSSLRQMKNRDMKVREMIRLIEAEGWRLDRMRGDHRIFKREGHNNVVVPGNLNDDMAIGTEMSCRRQASLKK